MSIYRGARTPWGCTVNVDGKPLDPRPDLRNHSPTGFEWGYGGSGPAQLALAILAHHYRNKDTLPPGDEVAISLYQRFKWLIVAKFPQKGFEIDTNYINLIIREIHGHKAIMPRNRAQGGAG